MKTVYSTVSSILFLTIFISVVHGFGFRRMGVGIQFYLKHLNLTDIVQNNAGSIKWIEQPLDHFNPNEARKWQMRYYEDLQFSKKDGPVYVYIGGESAADMDWKMLSYLLIHDLAKETNGAIFASEHRYYGQSVPLNLSVTQNLKYLSSRQALADVAYLIDSIRSRQEFRNSKVVVVGGSYAGNLAAWMRLLYPHKVYAAVASSAPVLAKKDFHEYIDKVADDYKIYGLKGCYDKISAIFMRYKKLLSTADGIKQLKQEEHICEKSDMTKQENKEAFFSDQLVTFEFLAQYRGPSEIKKHCSELMKNDLVEQKKLSGCNDYNFTNSIIYNKLDPDYTAWMYQTCTEFGYYQTTNSNKHPFTQSLPLEYFVKTCSAMFGSEFNEKRIDDGVALSNKQYGGLHPNVTNVIFVNGDVDPWSELGVLKDLSPNAPARLIHGTTHCADMFKERDTDSQALAEVKKLVKLTIKKWLKK